jgi:hypothetical protein
MKRREPDRAGIIRRQAVHQLGQINNQALRVAAHKIVEILRHASVGDHDRQRPGQ